MSPMKPAPAKALVYFRTLGCPKNQVDTEVMLGSTALGDYAIAERLEDADVAVVNTCSFIQSAREESIEAILDLADLREEGQLRGLIVTGCLPQRYGQELARELPEVDSFVGTGQFQGIVQILDEVLEGRSRGVYVDAGQTYLYDEDSPRLIIGGQHSAYVKVAEGCDRACAFCAIPEIRGPFQSRTLESVIAEARTLGREGAGEINVISQDTCSWGKDLYGRPRLHELIRALDAVEELDWVRLLYLYPTAVSDEVIEAIAGASRVLPYIDMPLQHASDNLLKAMKRGVTADRQRALIHKLRERIPNALLRSTFIVGFPGETDADFDALCDLLREARFERVGAFRYSDEEGTPAADFAEKVPREVAIERHRHLMALQQDIMRESLKKQVGSNERVLIDSSSTGTSIGRIWSQAPEVDGVVFLKSAAPRGEFVDARITGVRDLDLEAELL
ncbi:MAG: 30S ribosomal protein S12 methylthiotransferase RimO [bacterium]|nr:30S ribosomal protein S12 methylthiotransferase RimO [bacterium]